MKHAALVLLLAASGVSPEIRHFRYERTLESLPQQAGQACFALDASIFAHAAPQLADLRLYQGATETPYAVHLAAPAQTAHPILLTPLNLGRRNGQTVFDAELRETASRDSKYSDIELSVTDQNFLATVLVSGSREPATRNATEKNVTKLGSYTIFDLTRQKLGRSTVLHLPEWDFPYLHFQISGPIPPENIAGLSIARTSTVAPRYVTVAASPKTTQKGNSTVLEFAVPAYVPVDRVVFTPGAEPVNFSRAVSIETNELLPPSAKGASPHFESFGNLLRVHRTIDGHPLDEERLAIETAGEIYDVQTRWTITIDNGDDAPLALSPVELQMLERTVCFEAAANAAYTLYYGDAALAPPRYDYATLFAPQPDAAHPAPGPEHANPAYQGRPDNRPFSERHPAMLWVALVAVIALLGAIALRSARPATQTPQ